MSLLALTTVGMTTGCLATRKFARNTTNQSAQELTARMDQKDAELQNGIQTNSSQIEEINGVTRQHTEQISSLDNNLKQTDSKATQAMNVGQSAQSTAQQANTHITTLDQQFQNRNQYKPVSEQAIPFAFNSAKLPKDQTAALDEVAQKLKSSPNTILVLEGRTDNAGDPLYNIELGDKRVDSVVRYLVVEQGVPMQQIYKMSYGEDKPVAPNNTKEGRKQNRAVVIHVMEPDLGSASSVVSDAGSMAR